MSMTEPETDWADKIGKPAYESIADMVAALECDYDRLEELREMKAEWDKRDEKLDDDYPAEFDADDAEELEELEAAAGDHKDRDEAAERIQEDPLSIRIFGERVKGEWEVDKAEILLTTGGPAVRIMCEMDQHAEPHRAWLEVQDWSKPWTQYFGADQDVLLTYCRQFCFE